MDSIRTLLQKWSWKEIIEHSTVEEGWSTDLQILDQWVGDSLNTSSCHWKIGSSPKRTSTAQNQSQFG